MFVKYFVIFYLVCHVTKELIGSKSLLPGCSDTMLLIVRNFVLEKIISAAYFKCFMQTKKLQNYEFVHYAIQLKYCDD